VDVVDFLMWLKQEGKHSYVFERKETLCIPVKEEKRLSVCVNDWSVLANWALGCWWVFGIRNYQLSIFHSRWGV